MGSALTGLLHCCVVRMGKEAGATVTLIFYWIPKPQTEK